MSKDQVREALEAAKSAMHNDWCNAPRIGMEEASAKVTDALSALAAAPEVERVRACAFCTESIQSSESRVTTVVRHEPLRIVIAHRSCRDALLAPEPAAPSGEERQAAPGELPGSDSTEPPRDAEPARTNERRSTTRPESTTAAPSGEADVHGVTCKKVPHFDTRTGYLHGADDDSAYDVDGVDYCGRCHAVLTVAPTPEAAQAPTREADLYSPAKQLAKRHLTAPSKVKMLADDIHGYAITLHEAHAEDLAAANAELAKVREELATSERRADSRLEEIERLQKVRAEEEASLRARLEEAERERDAFHDGFNCYYELKNRLGLKKGQSLIKHVEALQARATDAEQRIGEARALIHDSPTSERERGWGSDVIFIGRPGVVEVQEGPPRSRRAYWRFVGLSDRWFRARNRFDALMQAAWACKMSAARADFRLLSDGGGEVAK